MKKKEFDVTIYYSGFCTYKIEAKNEKIAILKARTKTIDKNEIISNIESWEEADTAIEI